jgi:hypothetical protein
MAKGDTVLVSDLVMSEAYFALQHHYGLSKAQALRALRELVRESGIEATGASGSILDLPGLATSRPGFVDRLIHAEYARLADLMLSFETSAPRLAGVRVLRG